MARVAKTYQDQLKRIKINVEDSYSYFKTNNDRFHKIRRFVFDSTLTQDDKDKLAEMQKPQVEVNILEALVSRLLGDFSQQQPGIQVSSNPQSQNTDPRQIQVIEGYMRSILLDSNKSATRYEGYKDLLSGGFSVFKLLTKYENPYSFHQNIDFIKADDPTLCGFDPMARLPHKGDGRYCFELCPKTKEEFEIEFPDIDISQVLFTRSAEFEHFNWSYKNGKKEVVLVCDYYEKKTKRIKLIYAADQQSYTEEQYERLVMHYNANRFEQPPAVVTTRWTNSEVICRYRVIENQVLDYVETVYEMFPLIFVDGNSILLKAEGSNNAVAQFTRPYVYHAIDAQRIKNFALQTYANKIENMPQHQYLIDKNSIPEQYQDAYQNPQRASSLVYQSKDAQGNEVLPPQPVMVPPMPPEVAQLTFSMDQTIQAILGVYDAQMGDVTKRNLSGVAIIAGATQSNAAALPYVEGFMQGLNRVAEGCLNLIPKINVLPRLGKDGKRNYVRVNDKQGMQLNYAPYMMSVEVEAGVNFEIQKDQALNAITGLIQALPPTSWFTQFISQMGMSYILDNLSIHGIDQLKVSFEQFVQQQQQMQAQAQAMGAQANPAVQLKQAELQMKDQHHQDDMQLEQQKLVNEQQKIKNEKLKIQIDGANNARDDAIQLVKVKAEGENDATELALKKHDHVLRHADQLHRHTKEAIELGHQIQQDKQQSQQTGDSDG
jgi:hypothetical protein